MDTATATDPLAARARAVAESATLAIDTKAKALKASGADVISFGAGEPDFPTPAHIVAAAQAACADPATHRYSPAAGLPALRAAIAAATRQNSGLPVEAGQVLVTNGGKHALYTAFQTLLDPGDEVLLPAPYWVSYPEQVRLAGGVAVELPTDAGSGFMVSVEQLEAAVTPRTKALVFVSPSNPTGAVYPPQVVAAIGEWAAGAGIWVITDEIYEHLVFDGAQHVSMPSVAPAIRDRCVVISGVAKTYAMTGWRVGYVCAPHDLLEGIVKVHQYQIMSAPTTAQDAAVVALTGAEQDVRRMVDEYDRRRRLVVNGLNRIGLPTFEPRGAFYAFPRISGTGLSSEDFSERLLFEGQVAAIPGSAFGPSGEGHLRASYATSFEGIEEALVRIERFVGTLG